MVQLSLMPPETEPHVFSLGYQGRDPADLLRMAEELNAVVVDTRLKPWSRDQRWTQSNLRKVLGHRYVHIGAFGNLNYKNPELGIELENFDAGLAELQARKIDRAILVCACRQHHTCHRRLVVEKLAAATHAKITVLH